MSINENKKNGIDYHFYEVKKTKEYFKKKKSFIFEWTEKVFAEKLGSHTVLKVSSMCEPDEIYINGRKVKEITYA